MDVRQAIEQESAVVTGQPLKIPFCFKELSSLPKGKKIGDEIIITPIKTRTWFRLKPLLVRIERADLDKLTARQAGPFSAEMAEIMAKYDELLLDIVCIGIHNQSDDPPAWFREVLKDNATWEDVFVLLNAILYRLCHNPFLSSITLLKNVSPLSEEEIIALQKNEKMWTGR